MYKNMNNIPMLRCPECHKGKLIIDEKNIICDHCSIGFPTAHGKPVLIRHDNTLFPLENYESHVLPISKLRDVGARSFIPSPSVNLSQSIVLKKLRKVLIGKKDPTVLVVGCGVQRSVIQLGLGDKAIIIYIDVDLMADVDIYCDAHDLPFFSETYDAVITTAVIEHVLYPEKVAKEIARVIKCHGLLYSELPFMQQVHEGAYDFTRYTLSGHRRLFNKFTELESGMVAGPSTAFVWSIENLMLSFCRRIWVRKITKFFVRLIFSHIKYIDYLLIKRPEAMDAASCTYFYGYKSYNMTSDEEIIRSYVGGKHITHA